MCVVFVYSVCVMCVYVGVSVHCLKIVIPMHWHKDCIIGCVCVFFGQVVGGERNS